MPALTFLFMTVGEVLRDERKRQGLTQQDLAARAEISLRYLSEIENGQNVTIDMLTKVMKALRLSRVTIGEIEVELAPEQQRTLDLFGSLTPTSQARLVEFLKSLSGEGSKTPAPITTSTRPSAPGAKAGDEGATIDPSQNRFK